MKRDVRQVLRAIVCLAAAWCALLPVTGHGAEPDDSEDRSVLRLQLRTRVETFRGSGAWDEVTVVRELPASETAVLICDMWDDHWCSAAATRCAKLAEKMAPVVDAARSRGLLVVHAPSETMDFYSQSPQRRRILDVSLVQPEKNLELVDPPLPIDASDGGCDSPDTFFKAWSRQHPAITIADEDVIDDQGDRIYSYLHQRGVKNVIFMGVHTNMCVLGRSFGIRQMTRWGMNCILVRDLTDTMYDPQDPPHVSHDEGTELVVQHIEKYWGPSIESGDLLARRQGR